MGTVGQRINGSRWDSLYFPGEEERRVATKADRNTKDFGWNSAHPGPKCWVQRRRCGVRPSGEHRSTFARRSIPCQTQHHFCTIRTGWRCSSSVTGPTASSSDAASVFDDGEARAGAICDVWRTGCHQARGDRTKEEQKKQSTPSAISKSTTRPEGTYPTTVVPSSSWWSAIVVSLALTPTS